MTFPIEKGIPPPEDKPKTRNQYPFNEMKVGDSFFVPFREDEDERVVRNKIGTAARGARWRTGMKFVSRAVEGGVRVWRVE